MPNLPAVLIAYKVTWIRLNAPSIKLYRNAKNMLLLEVTLLLLLKCVGMQQQFKLASLVSNASSSIFPALMNKKFLISFTDFQEVLTVSPTPIFG